MPTSEYGVYYPSPSQAPAAAADMMALAESFGDRLVLKVADAADRNARYGDAPEGSLAVAGSPLHVWIKQSAAVGDWGDFADTTYRPNLTTVPAAPNYTGNQLGYRRWNNGLVQWQGNVHKNSGVMDEGTYPAFLAIPEEAKPPVATPFTAIFNGPEFGRFIFNPPGTSVSLFVPAPNRTDVYLDGISYYVSI